MVLYTQRIHDKLYQSGGVGLGVLTNCACSVRQHPTTVLKFLGMWEGCLASILSCPQYQLHKQKAKVTQCKQT